MVSRRLNRFIALLLMVQLLFPARLLAQNVVPANHVHIASGSGGTIAPVVHHWHNFAGTSPNLATHVIVPGVITPPNHAGALTAGAFNPSTLLTHTRPQINLDLTSTAASAVAGFLARSGNLSIDVGHSSLAVTPTTVLTAAEKLALFQVVSTGQQSLQIGSLGNAVGGTFTIGPGLSHHLASLVIPQGVTALDRSSSLALSGNLSNSGSLFAVSPGSSVSISALNIFNLPGGLISSALAGNISGTTGNTSPITLNLIAAQNLVNSGAISSSGNLNITAGNVLNQGSIASAGSANLSLSNQLTNASAAQLISQQSLNITASSLVNAGLISAQNGALSIFGAGSQQPLNIANQGGVLQALNAALAITSNSGLNVYGGSISGLNVNFSAPASSLFVAADSISGPVSVSGQAAQVHTAGNLVISSVNVTGDPIFTSSTSDVTLPSSITTGGQTTGGPVTAIAYGNIFGASGGGTTINTSGTTNGGAVFLLAGAANSTVANVTTVTGPSGNGGSISGINSITTSGVGSGTGGNVFLGAYGGSVTIGGAITTDSPGGGTPGTLTIYSPGNINVGNVSAQGSHTAGTWVNIQSATPNITTSYQFDSQGNQQAGAMSAGSAGTGSITIGSINTSSSTARGGDINLIAPAGVATTNAATGFIRSYGGNPQTAGSSGGGGGVINIQAPSGAINITGDVNSSGGGGSGGAAWGNPGGAGGAAGNVTIAAQSTLTIAGPVLAAGGGGAGGSTYCCVNGGGGGSFGVSGISPSNGSANGGGFTAGTFGVGGTASSTDNGGNVGFPGTSGGGAGGAAGSMGSISLSGSSITITRSVGNSTIGAAFSGSGFSGSPFANDSIVGGNVSVVPVGGSGSVSVAGSISGINGMVTVTSPTTLSVFGIDNSTNAVFNIQSPQVAIGSVAATGSSFALYVSNGNLNMGSISDAGGSVSLSVPNGTLSTSFIDTSGTTTAGGSLSLFSSGAITTGYLRSYGGNSGAAGAAGYAGGAIDVVSSGGLINIQGDINSSGAGGNGGGMWGLNGGAGGTGGNVTVSASGTVTVAGPVLAAGGGGGGGSTYCCNSGGGGGSLGIGGISPTNGSGYGGGFTGGTIGVGGSGSNTNPGGNVGLSGASNGGIGGAGGGMGSVYLSGTSVTVSRSVGNSTIGAAFSGTGFSGSAFANDSIVGGNISVQPTVNSGSVAIAGSIAGIGGSVSIISPTTASVYGIDNSYNANFNIQAAQLTIGAVQASGSILNLAVSNGSLSMGSIVNTGAPVAISLANGALTTGFIDVSSTSAAGGSINLTATGNIITGYLRSYGGASSAGGGAGFALLV